jgi:hypothetical protein
MSTSAEHFVALTAPVERRFYRRIVPSALVYLAFGQNRVGMLLNVSENGLLVSTPLGLTRNFVYRVSLRLNGLPRAIQVRVRVVWTTESKRAGIQLLDLGEHDREQLRKWGALEGARETSSEPFASPHNSKPSQKTTESSPVAAEPPKIPAPVANTPSARPGLPRTPATSATLAFVTSATLAVVGLAVGLFFGNRPFHEAFIRFAGAGKDSAADTATSTNTLRQRTKDAQTRVSIVGLNPISKDAAQQTAASVTGSADSFLNIPTDKRLERKIPVAKIDWDSFSQRPARVPAKANLDASGSGATTSTSGQLSTNSPIPESIASDSTDSDKPSLPNDLPPAAPSGNASVPFALPILPPPPRATRTSRIEGTPDPVVVHLDVPESRVIEVTPPSSHASLVSLPGERVFQSPSVTIHIQRSILMPAGPKAWLSGRSKKVLLGELLSRVDPQTPHLQVRSGASVSVRAVLDKNGRVENLKPVNGSITLVPSVIRAVREWRYQPTLLDGKPVETEAYVLVEFHPSASPVSRP